MRAWRLACCALAVAAGCQPWQPMSPLAPLQPAAPQVVGAAPPAVSGQGMMVDPFAFDPNTGAPSLGPIAATAEGGPSRVVVPVANRDWTWEQIVDVVDDYFRVQRERQVQLVGDVLTEGRIDSYPLVGATVVEPHRRDSVGRYNRWESTFQTIRRRATVRVIPDAAGYLVDVTVEKDLEDLPRPENAAAGAATFRNDSSLPSEREDVVSRTQLAGNWIYIGRDPALEQQILADLQARLSIQPTPYVAQQ
jgi:hypothetical protein